MQVPNEKQAVVALPIPICIFREVVLSLSFCSCRIENRQNQVFRRCIRLIILESMRKYMLPHDNNNGLMPLTGCSINYATHHYYIPIEFYLLDPTFDLVMTKAISPV